MKKIFTLIAGAALTMSASAQDASWWIAPAEAPTAGTVIIDDALLTANTVFETNCKEDPRTIDGVDFSYYMQVRIDKAPNADNPNGTDKGGSTPIAVQTKKPLIVTCYYRRQAADGIFTPNDGKDIKVYDKNANFATLTGDLKVCEITEDEAYAYVTTTYTLKGNNEYLIAARGTTLQLYGFSYVIDPNGGGDEPDPGTDPTPDPEVTSRIPTTAPANAIAYWYNVNNAEDYTAPVGTFVADDDGVSVNYANGPYMTIRVNGKKADVPTNAVLVTPTQALKAGDEIIVKAYRNKDTNAGASLYIEFSNKTNVTLGAGNDGTEINNLALDQQPNELSYIVTDAEAGSTSLYLSRDKASTNIFVVAFQITDGPCGIGSVAVDANNDGRSYNMLGQPVDENYKGIVIRNGQKFIQR